MHIGELARKLGRTGIVDAVLSALGLQSPGLASWEDPACLLLGKDFPSGEWIAITVAPAVKGFSINVAAPSAITGLDDGGHDDLVPVTRAWWDEHEPADGSPFHLYSDSETPSIQVETEVVFHHPTRGQARLLWQAAKTTFTQTQDDSGKTTVIYSTAGN